MAVISARVTMMKRPFVIASVWKLCRTKVLVNSIHIEARVSIMVCQCTRKCLNVTEVDYGLPPRGTKGILAPLQTPYSQDNYNGNRVIL